MTDPDRISSDARRLSKKRQYSEAISLFTAALDARPGDISIRRDRAHAFAKLDRWNEAIGDIDKIIELGSEEPDDFFSRGRWKLAIGSVHDAIDDFTEILDLEKKFESTYYTEAAYFFRAEANYLAGNLEESLLDCKQVRSDMAISINGKYRTREDIESDCKL